MNNRGCFMNEKNTKKLFDKYSSLFKNKEDITHSLMCFGFECDDGWYKMIYLLLQDLQELKLNDNFYITQIKQKFGGLRVYTSYTNDDIDLIIQGYGDLSYKICECCGEEGVLRKDLSWIQVLCDTCMNKTIKERELRLKKWALEHTKSKLRKEKKVSNKK